MSIFAAFILALVISLVFAPGYRRGSFSPLIIFFFILFLGGVASQYWLTPFGPTMWGVAWLPLLVILLIFSLLFAAPSPYVRGAEKKADTPESTAVGVAAISIFIWILLPLLMVAILIGFLRLPSTV